MRGRERVREIGKDTFRMSSVRGTDIICSSLYVDCHVHIQFIQDNVQVLMDTINKEGKQLSGIVLSLAHKCQSKAAELCLHKRSSHEIT